MICLELIIGVAESDKTQSIRPNYLDARVRGHDVQPVGCLD